MIRVTLPLLMMGIALGGETHQFSHFQHVKKEDLACTDCHNKTINSTTLADARLGLKLNACAKCHSDDTNFNTPKPIVLADSSFRIQRADGPDLKFNHKAHIGANVECASCHGQLIGPPDSGQAVVAVVPAKNLLEMQSCMECHVKKAEVACLTCHTKIDKPISHMSAAWVRGEAHGLQSELGNQDCSMCHEKGQVTTCAECHMGSDARKVHGLNYRFNHGVDVKFKKSDCSVCHAPLDQFCADCHEGKGRQLR